MTNIAIINRTIEEMCFELSNNEHIYKDWHTMSEEELFREIAVCIFGSQMLFEQANAIIEHLYNCGFFDKINLIRNWEKYRNDLIVALSIPLEYRTSNSEIRPFYPRFKNRLSSLLVSTMSNFQTTGITIREILASPKPPKEVRKTLVEYINGFGPKQSSLFLRRIGYSLDLAVLDIHIIDYILLSKNIDIHISKLGSIDYYENIESEFRIIVQELKHPLGCIDLATWITMRVAKKERYI